MKNIMREHCNVVEHILFSRSYLLYYSRKYDKAVINNKHIQLSEYITDWP